ncbi:hypothetical protein TNCV_4692131 [Trichonephila clavipes]|nr:hypothetical protein TNCV_4692131 [Trichonephila clavipes]
MGTSTGCPKRGPACNMDGLQISCAALRALALNSREQLIREQREDPELGHFYRNLENPDNESTTFKILSSRLGLRTALHRPATCVVM